MFRRGDASIRSVAANNVHENVGGVQEGGTALLAYGVIIGQYDIKQSRKDKSGLGRWVVMKFVEQMATRLE